MLNVYYVSGILLLPPLMESIGAYRSNLRKTTRAIQPAGRVFVGNILFAAALLAAFLPTLITKHSVYGSYLNFGYERHWRWNSPAFLNVCFSADHVAIYAATAATTVPVLWNFGLIFQWGMHWIPERGPVSWRAAAHNQVAIVPGEAASILKTYLTGRSALMDRIEQRDVQQLQQSQGAK